MVIITIIIKGITGFISNERKSLIITVIYILGHTPIQVL